MLVGPAAPELELPWSSVGTRTRCPPYVPRMTNAPTRSATPPRPVRDAAFVVHLATVPPGLPAQAQGRVEHVATGRAARFESSEDLMRFMHETLAALAADDR